MTAGCGERVVVKTDFCTGWEPIYVSPQDVLTDGTAKAIRSHDEHGVKVHCWRAPSPKSSKADSVDKSAAAH